MRLTVFVWAFIANIYDRGYKFCTQLKNSLFLVLIQSWCPFCITTATNVPANFSVQPHSLHNPQQLIVVSTITHYYLCGQKLAYLQNHSLLNQCTRDSYAGALESGTIIQIHTRRRPRAMHRKRATVTTPAQWPSDGPLCKLCFVTF